MTNNKIIIAITTTVIVIASLLTYLELTKEQVKVHLAKAGLEQCTQFGPQSIRSNTIWVKNCREYYKSLKDN